MIRLLSGDCRDVLATLPAESVQCVVTSPPYYGLRDYGTALWDGGDAACDHRIKTRFDYPLNAGLGQTGVQTQASNAASNGAAQYRDTCGKCGAVRVDRQIGLEATPDEYLATMVAVFRQIRRAMRPDAVAFINMGDSYSDKQLLLMPARLALALQADGWWVRSAIVWAKPNPMPESVTDRPTSAYEMVYLLTRSARYYYDADAVRETTGNEMAPDEYASAVSGYPGRSNDMQDFGGGRGRKGFLSATPPSGRNLRNVWTIATSPFSAAHFATFPPELAERCIKAGTSERGCCAACGKPWVRMTEQTRASSWEARKAAGHVGGIGGSVKLQREHQTADYDCPEGGFGWTAKYETTGWAPGCQCGTDTVPCTVLDPFAGAGTTLLVADRLQRDAIGVELNTAYTEMAMERCRADAPLFTSFPPAEPPEDERMADLFAGDEYERSSKARTTPRNDGNRWNENNGRGFLPRRTLPDMAAD